LTCENRENKVFTPCRQDLGSGRLLRSVVRCGRFVEEGCVRCRVKGEDGDLQGEEGEDEAGAFGDIGEPAVRIAPMD
jgi:hypothetical protein